MHFYQNVRSDQQNSATKKCVYSFTCVAQQMLETAEFLVGLWQSQKKAQNATSKSSVRHTGRGFLFTGTDLGQALSL